ncbi:hypothetical protein GCM10008983_13030 [Lentibacillus halophilus]|uniref:DUF4366 domain-containing protein n=1 Tax=Lentibacillus halophilus TaxID=295065 RepID=A0ABP3J1M1_9BACI
MKTLFLSSAAGALLLSGGLTGMGGAQATDAPDQGNAQTPTHQVSSENVKISSNVQTYAEYEVLDEHVNDVEDYQVNVVANNANKRVIILSDDNNQEQYKSVFVKNNDRLKIIDLDNGPIFNNVLTNSEADNDDDAAEDENESSDEASNDVDDFPEFDTLEDEVNADDDQVRIVEDNQHKRVMYVQDEDRQNEYKSIFIKDTNRLKIIDLDNGQVFNQVLTDSDKQEADDDDDAAEDKNESSDEASGDVEDFPEFDTLENEINADDDQARIAEDNQHKRVMFVQSEDSQNQYKSIFIKDTNRLKIIDLNHGQVFNQQIK